MKIFDQNSQKGFVLIAAILALMILMAVGVLVFTVTNQDIRISSRTVGEKQAFLSAEAGIHDLMQNFDPTDPSKAAKNTPVAVDPNDPSSQFTVTIPVAPTRGPAAFPLPGYNMIAGDNWGLVRYVATVTGTNTRFSSQVQIDVGVGYGPVDITYIYR